MRSSLTLMVTEWRWRRGCMWLMALTVVVLCVAAAGVVVAACLVAHHQHGGLCTARTNFVPYSRWDIFPGLPFRSLKKKTPSLIRCDSWLLFPWPPNQKKSSSMGRTKYRRILQKRSHTGNYYAKKIYRCITLGMMSSCYEHSRYEASAWSRSLKEDVNPAAYGRMGKRNHFSVRSSSSG